MASLFTVSSDAAWCVGSSHGWLVNLATDQGSPFLLNPTSSARIPLPPFSPAFMNRAGVTHSYFVQELLKTFVSKAVLMMRSDPSPSQYAVAMLFSYPCRLAVCSDATSTWVELPGAKRSYCDIVFHNNNLYALTEDGSVEEWDLHQEVPRKIQDFKPTMERDDGDEEREFRRDRFSSKLYLVMSEGEMLLAERLIGDFVNAEGEVVYEGYEPPSGGDEICPYRTKQFAVYKLDSMKNMWVKKSSLGDRALFLGTNESTSVSAKEIRGCKPNSIYFTDDRVEEMSLDYSYGGHDWGVFGLQDRCVQLLAPFEYKIDPPPVWVIRVPT